MVHEADRNQSAERPQVFLEALFEVHDGGDQIGAAVLVAQSARRRGPKAVPRRPRQVSALLCAVYGVGALHAPAAEPVAVAVFRSVEQHTRICD